MAKYINADEVIEKLREVDSKGIKANLTSLVALVTVMPESIVRCKDCKHYTEWLFSLNPKKQFYCSGGFVDSDTALRPDDYCSHGERRESNGRA